MPFVTKERWRGRGWRTERVGLVDGRAEAVVAAWGATVRKRLLAPVAAHASLDGGHRFDLDASSRLEWTTAAGLAPFETEPGELAHLAEGGAHVSCLRLSRMPDKCLWQHKLELPGVRLVYQPALSAAEVAEGCMRPPAVVGSYAAYATDDGRKVAHIPRPVAVDGHGNRVWGILEIAAGISTVRFDPAALRSLAWGGDGIAIYGLDTFGYTSVGGSGGAKASDNVFAAGPYMGAEGTATSVSWYLHCYVGGTTQVTMGFCDDTGASYPGDLQRDSAGGAYSYGTKGWIEQALDSSVAVTAQDYWIAANYDKNVNLYWDSVAGYYQKWKASTYSHGSLPDPFPGGGSSVSGRKYSCYVTYTPAGGGGALPVAMHHYRLRR